MATTSFFKQVIIEDSKDCEALVNALESAIVLRSTCTNVPKPTYPTPEELKNMAFVLNRQ